MTILLVPGFMLDADLWTDMRPGLAAISPVIDADVTRDHATARIQAMSRHPGDDVFRQQSALVRVDDTARLRQITCPTLIVAAAQDLLRPLEESRVLHAGIANARREVVETSGHMIPLEQPQALLRWLQRFVAPLWHGGESVANGRN